MKPGSSGSRRLPSGTPILVVEDNDANRILALRLLERLGYVATAARNGREALEAIAKDRYSLVLMDCQMPEMDGFEATRAIRRQEAAGGERLPIVAMTASATASPAPFRSGRCSASSRIPRTSRSWSACSPTVPA